MATVAIAPVVTTRPTMPANSLARSTVPTCSKVIRALTQQPMTCKVSDGPCMLARQRLTQIMMAANASRPDGGDSGGMGGGGSGGGGSGGGGSAGDDARRSSCTVGEGDGKHGAADGDQGWSSCLKSRQSSDSMFCSA